MTNVSAVKAKLKPPAIGIIINAVIGLGFSLYMFFLQQGPMGSISQEQGALLKTWNILCLAGHIFCIYGAVQVMNAKQYGLAVASSIVTIVTGLQTFIGLPIGIWALIVLLKSEVKLGFAENSTT